MLETIILNLIYLSFPLMLYIIYNMYANIRQKEVNKLLSTFLIGTSFYFLIRFGEREFLKLPFLLINVPLLISYVRKNQIAILILSISLLFYYVDFGYSFILTSIFLLIDYILYKLLDKNFTKREYFVFLFILINIFLVFIESYFRILDISWLDLGIYFIANILLSYIVVILFENSDRMAKLHNTFKEMEHEEQVRLSIFKISHEIKNPIAVCKGYLDMFDSSNPEHSTKYIPIIRSEINRTLCLLQDFLEFNKIKIEKEEMDLIVLLEELEGSCAPLLNNNKIEYRMLGCEEEIYLQGDFNRLKQVCINMIKNSIESLKNIENPYIQISYLIKKNYVHLYIEDNGCGMSKETLKKIKEPFYTTKATGSGLGVTISLEVIRAHNGTINYFSKENKGTKVEIILPLK